MFRYFSILPNKDSYQSVEQYNYCTDGNIKFQMIAFLYALFTQSESVPEGCLSKLFECFLLSLSDEIVTHGTRKFLDNMWEKLIDTYETHLKNEPKLNQFVPIDNQIDEKLYFRDSFNLPTIPPLMPYYNSNILPSLFDSLLKVLEYIFPGTHSNVLLVLDIMVERMKKRFPSDSILLKYSDFFEILTIKACKCIQSSNSRLNIAGLAILSHLLKLLQDEYSEIYILRYFSLILNSLFLALELCKVENTTIISQKVSNQFNDIIERIPNRIRYDNKAFRDIAELYKNYFDLDFYKRILELGTCYLLSVNHINRSKSQSLIELALSCYVDKASIIQEMQDKIIGISNNVFGSIFNHSKSTIQSNMESAIYKSLKFKTAIVDALSFVVDLNPKTVKIDQIVYRDQIIESSLKLIPSEITEMQYYRNRMNSIYNYDKTLTDEELYQKSIINLCCSLPSLTESYYKYIEYLICFLEYNGPISEIANKQMSKKLSDLMSASKSDSKSGEPPQKLYIKNIKNSSMLNIKTITAVTHIFEIIPKKLSAKTITAYIGHLENWIKETGDDLTKTNGIGNIAALIETLTCLCALLLNLLDKNESEMAWVHQKILSIVPKVLDLEKKAINKKDLNNYYLVKIIKINLIKLMEVNANLFLHDFLSSLTISTPSSYFYTFLFLLPESNSVVKIFLKDFQNRIIDYLKGEHTKTILLVLIHDFSKKNNEFFNKNCSQLISFLKSDPVQTVEKKNNDCKLILSCILASDTSEDSLSVKEFFSLINYLHINDSSIQKFIQYYFQSRINLISLKRRKEIYVFWIENYFFNIDISIKEIYKLNVVKHVIIPLLRFSIHNENEMNVEKEDLLLDRELANLLISIYSNLKIYVMEELTIFRTEYYIEYHILFCELLELLIEENCKSNNELVELYKILLKLIQEFFDILRSNTKKPDFITAAYFLINPILENEPLANQVVSLSNFEDTPYFKYTLMKYSKYIASNPTVIKMITERMKNIRVLKRSVNNFPHLFYSDKSPELIFKSLLTTNFKTSDKTGLIKDITTSLHFIRHYFIYKEEHQPAVPDPKRVCTDLDAEIIRYTHEVFKKLKELCVSILQDNLLYPMHLFSLFDLFTDVYHSFDAAQIFTDKTNSNIPMTLFNCYIVNKNPRLINNFDVQDELLDRLINCNSDASADQHERLFAANYLGKINELIVNDKVLNEKRAEPREPTIIDKLKRYMQKKIGECTKPERIFIGKMLEDPCISTKRLIKETCLNSGRFTNFIISDLFIFLRIYELTQGKVGISLMYKKIKELPKNPWDDYSNHFEWFNCIVLICHCIVKHIFYLDEDSRVKFYSLFENILGAIPSIVLHGCIIRTINDLLPKFTRETSHILERLIDCVLKFSYYGNHNIYIQNLETILQIVSKNQYLSQSKKDHYYYVFLSSRCCAIREEAIVYFSDRIGKTFFSRLDFFFSIKESPFLKFTNWMTMGVTLILDLLLKIERASSNSFKELDFYSISDFCINSVLPTKNMFASLQSICCADNIILNEIWKQLISSIWPMISYTEQCNLVIKMSEFLKLSFMSTKLTTNTYYPVFSRYNNYFMNSLTDFIFKFDYIQQPIEILLNGIAKISPIPYIKINVLEPKTKLFNCYHIVEYILERYFILSDNKKEIGSFLSSTIQRHNQADISLGILQTSSEYKDPFFYEMMEKYKKALSEYSSIFSELDYVEPIYQKHWIICDEYLQNFTYDDKSRTRDYNRIEHDWRSGDIEKLQRTVDDIKRRTDILSIPGIDELPFYYCYISKDEYRLNESFMTEWFYQPFISYRLVKPLYYLQLSDPIETREKFKNNKYSALNEWEDILHNHDILLSLDYFERTPEIRMKQKELIDIQMLKILRAHIVDNPLFVSNTYNVPEIFGKKPDFIYEFINLSAKSRSLDLLGFINKYFYCKKNDFESLFKMDKNSQVLMSYFNILGLCCHFEASKKAYDPMPLKTLFSLSCSYSANAEIYVYYAKFLDKIKKDRLEADVIMYYLKGISLSSANIPLLSRVIFLITKFPTSESLNFDALCDRVSFWLWIKFFPLLMASSAPNVKKLTNSFLHRVPIFFVYPLALEYYEYLKDYEDCIGTETTKLLLAVVNIDISFNKTKYFP